LFIYFSLDLIYKDYWEYGVFSILPINFIFGQLIQYYEGLYNALPGSTPGSGSLRQLPAAAGTARQGHAGGMQIACGSVRLAEVCGAFLIVFLIIFLMSILIRKMQSILLRGQVSVELHTPQLTVLDVWAQKSSRIC
jgi:hypothetical protein